jgi:MerR family transcriptional regulator, redox-sensitive transcriptional activator SoxR
MPQMPIGKLARLAGVPASTIRYYEQAGLLPEPARQWGQRRYGRQAAARLRIIRVAREAGFSIAETRTFLSGFSANTPPAARWRELAQRKLAQIETQVAQLARMRKVLDSSFHCRCVSIEDCERAMAAAGAPPARSGARRRC